MVNIASNDLHGIILVIATWYDTWHDNWTFCFIIIGTFKKPGSATQIHLENVILFGTYISFITISNHPQISPKSPPAFLNTYYIIAFDYDVI